MLLHQVVFLSLAHYITCLSVYSIITAPERHMTCRPLLSLSLCPRFACTSCCPLSGVARPLSGCFFVSSWLWVCCRITNPSLRLCMVTFVPLFCFILSSIGRKVHCYLHTTVMHTSHNLQFLCQHQCEQYDHAVVHPITLAMDPHRAERYLSPSCTAPTSDRFVWPMTRPVG